MSSCLGDVRRLLIIKREATEATANILLSTADMGYSLDEEEGVITCVDDERQGKKVHRYLAPAISRYALKLAEASESDQSGDPAVRGSGKR